MTDAVHHYCLSGLLQRFSVANICGDVLFTVRQTKRGVAVTTCDSHEPRTNPHPCPSNECSKRAHKPVYQRQQHCWSRVAQISGVGLPDQHILKRVRIPLSPQPVNVLVTTFVRTPYTHWTRTSKASYYRRITALCKCFPPPFLHRRQNTTSRGRRNITLHIHRHRTSLSVTNSVT